MLFHYPIALLGAISFFGLPAHTIPVSQPLKAKRIHVTKQELVQGEPRIISGIIKPPGGSFTLTKAHLEGMTVNLGLNLGINSDSLSGQLSLGVSLVTEDLYSDATTQNCPPNHYCRATFTPILAHITGYEYSVIRGNQPFDVLVPTALQNSENKSPNGSSQICYIPPDTSEPQCPPDPSTPEFATNDTASTPFAKSGQGQAGNSQ